MSRWTAARDTIPAVLRMSLARGERVRGRKGARGLLAALAALPLVFRLWLDAAGPAGEFERGMIHVHAWGGVALGSLLALGAASGVSGPGRQRELGLVASTGIDPLHYLIGIWLAQVAGVLSIAAGLVPALAALLFLGGGEVRLLGLAALALVQCVGVAAALALALTVGAASNRVAGSVVLLGLLALGVIPPLLRSVSYAGAVSALLPLLPFSPLLRDVAPLWGTGPLWGSGLAALAATLGLLGLAAFRLGRRYRAGADSRSVLAPSGTSPGPLRARPSRPVGEGALSWLATARLHRAARGAQGAVALVLLLGLAAAAMSAGQGVLFERVTLIVVTSLLGAASGILILAGPTLFWNRILAGGFSSLLWIAPVSARELMLASLRSAWTFAAPPLAALLLLLGVLSAWSATLAVFPLVLLAGLAAALQVAIAVSVDGVRSALAAHRKQIQQSTVLLLLLGPALGFLCCNPVLPILGLVVFALLRSRAGPALREVSSLGEAWILALGPGVVSMGLSLLPGVHGVGPIGFAASPIAGAGLSVGVAAGAGRTEPILLLALALAALLLAAGSWWLYSRFERELERTLQGRP